MFKCIAYANITGEDRSKLDAKSRYYIFLGY